VSGADERPVGVVPRLDHLVYAVPDLAEAVAALGARLGVTPAAGGRHTGLGTANALLALGPLAYLEVIGPDPAQPPARGPRPFGLDDLAAPRLVAWAIHTDRIELEATEARRRGYDPGPVEAMTRELPSGGRLAWRLTRGSVAAGVAVVPFLIDWGPSPHPAASAPAGVRLLGLGAGHPDPRSVQARCAALRVELPISPATEPSLWAQLAAAGGTVELG